MADENLVQEEVMTFENLSYFKGKQDTFNDQKIKTAKDEAIAHANSLADNYDPAGSAVTEAGKVQTNLDKEVARAQGAEQALADRATALVAKDTELQNEIDAIETDMGNVDDLQTANKTVAGAINEVLAAVGTGGTAAVVTVTTDTTSEGALKSYTIKQGETTVGVIDIPKDMVVESGEVVTNPEGQAEGTYIKLTLANVADPLYINVGTLVDIYKAKANATQIQLAIDSATREISATIVAGSVGTTELADGAVTTVKIADANVTLAKLSTSVQASLKKADEAAPQTKLDEEVQSRKDADAALDDRIKVVEGKAHEHANKEVLDGVSAEKVAAWDASEGNAKAYADEKNTAMDTRVKAIEEAMGEGGSVGTQIDEKIADLDANVSSTEPEAGKGLKVQVVETDGKVASVAVTGNFDNTYDAKGAADTAKAEAIAHADGKDEAIAEAKQAGVDAGNAVTALQNGAVADNAQAIADIRAAMPTPISTEKIDELFAAV